MKLTARQKYDYRDLDRVEARLIRIGHAIWRDRRKLVDTVTEREAINEALESVWQAKREYRTELAKKRAVRFSEYRNALLRPCDLAEASSVGDDGVALEEGRINRSGDLIPRQSILLAHIRDPMIGWKSAASSCKSVRGRRHERR